MDWKISILYILLAFIHQIRAVIKENIYESGCTDDKLTLRCPEDHRIAIKRLFFGAKRTWDCRQPSPRRHVCCQATHMDCLVNDDTKYPALNTRCSGYRQCEIVVQKTKTGAACPDIQYTDYMTVIYDCVPEMDIATFCSNDFKRNNVLYLANAEYPSSVRDEKMDCSCMVRTGGSEGINIHSIDALLTWSEQTPRSCNRQMIIKDEKGYKWDIMCGHLGFYGFRTIYTRPVSNVTLTLKSSAGKGSAFVWLQIRATEPDDQVEIFCGEPLRLLLFRVRQEVESRHRNDGKVIEGTTLPNKNFDGVRNSSFPFAAHSGSLSSNLAAIIGGIVAAGFVLISIVIIALAFHCKRQQQSKQKTNPIMLYPAVSDSESSNLTSYCRYDYDDDHYSSINRSPLKMTTLTDTSPTTNFARNGIGYVTLASSEARTDNHVNLDDSNNGQVAPHPGDNTREALLSNPNYSGHLSLRFGRTNGNIHTADIHDGHKTLPDNRSKILVSGPKSPLGKRSKSVTFSQPVAMVTPLPSGSEESMEGEVNLKGSPMSSLDDGNYDNLNKIFIPDHPISPSMAETVPIQCPYPVTGLHSNQSNKSNLHQTGNTGSLPHSLSTFRAEDLKNKNSIGMRDYDDVPFGYPPPPPPVIINGDTYASVHKKPKTTSVYHPQKQNAQLYETGV